MIIKKNSYTLQLMESSNKNYFCVQTVLSIKLKFDKYLVDYRFSCYIYFGVNRRYSFSLEAHNVIHYGHWAQNIRDRFSIDKLLESVQN